MLNKKLTKKNIGNKRWKSKKRKRVLRGGEDGDETIIDGTMICPKILKVDKIIQISTNREPQRLGFFKKNINVMQDEVLKRIKGLINDSVKDTRSPTMQYYKIIYDFGTFCKCIYTYDNTPIYTLLFKYIENNNKSTISDEDIKLQFNNLKSSYQDKYLYENKICKYITYKVQDNNLIKKNNGDTLFIPLYFHELFGINFNEYQSICKSNTDILKKFPNNRETTFDNANKQIILNELNAQIAKLKQLLKTIEENINKYNIIYELVNKPDIKQEPLSDDTIINNIKNDINVKLNNYLISVKRTWHKMKKLDKNNAEKILRKKIIDYMDDKFGISIL